MNETELIAAYGGLPVERELLSINHANEQNEEEQKRGTKVMPLITVNRGGPDIPAGVYPVVLVEIEGPKTITPQSGPNSGKDVEILSWTFAIDDGEYDGVEIEATTSVASGPRSKLYGFLTALFGGTAPQIGASFESSDLAGRRALATISISDSGWPRIENLGAMPKSMLAQGIAKATGTSTKEPAGSTPVAAAAPLRETVTAATGDDLPF